MSDEIQNNGGGNTEAVKQRPNISARDEKDARGRSGSSLIRPIARMPVDKNAPYYNMNHKNRGMAVIFNHEKFDPGLGLSIRTGTAVDSNNLKKVLKNLGFNVTVHTDLKAIEVLRYIKETAEMDHSENDCLVIVLMTHGHEGNLYAKDAHYKSDSLGQWFTADKCPTLAGKPKLFFIQACRGEQYDGGITMTSRIETDGLSTSSYSIPIQADFLMMCSTVPGYYSWRNPIHGSWFIQALCEELRDTAAERDILTLLTFVCQKVALNYESNTDSPSSHQQKQVPCTMP